MGLFFPKTEQRSGPSAGELVQAAQMMRLAPQAVNVTDQVALTHSAVWACSSLYARLISTLPFHAYRDQGGIDVRIGDPQILRQPNGTQPLSSWLSQAVYSLVLRGNVVDTRPQSELDLTSPDALTPTPHSLPLT